MVATITRFAASNLRILNLRNCWHISDASLSAVSISSPLIEVLDLNSCWEVTEGGLLSLTQTCHKIKCLDLSNCKKVRGERKREITFDNVDLY